MEGDYYSNMRSAINTMKATRLELLKARLFGKKVFGYDPKFNGTRTRVEMRLYKGKYYFMNSTEVSSDG